MKIDGNTSFARKPSTVWLAIGTITPNLEGKDNRTHILCRATHIHDAIVQTSINIDVACADAFNPIIALTLHKDKPLLKYQDFVLPGTTIQRLISLLYVYMVGICWCVYMAATLCLAINIYIIVDCDTIGVCDSICICIFRNKCCTVDGCAADANGGAGRNRILEKIRPGFDRTFWPPIWYT